MAAWPFAKQRLRARWSPRCFLAAWLPWFGEVCCDYFRRQHYSGSAGKTRYREKLRDSEQQLSARAKAKAKAKGKPSAAAAKKTRGRIADGTRIYPDLVEAGALSAEEALVFLPEGSTCGKDPRENRWRLCLGAAKVTRVWATRGEFPAFRVAAKELWRRHNLATGEECPWDWILDDAGGADDLLGFEF